MLQLLFVVATVGAYQMETRVRPAVPKPKPMAPKPKKVLSVYDLPLAPLKTTKKTQQKRELPPLDMECGTQERYAAERDFPELAKEYWVDPRIHGFGNVGFGGLVHALVAPMFTAMLDAFAYDGKDVREEAWKLIKKVRKNAAIRSAVDLGCGTGFTARSVVEHVSKSCKVIAIDTSKEMLRAAKDMTSTTRNIDFTQANAEATGLASGKFDLVTAAFVLHECPRKARHAIFEEAMRLLAPGGTIAILDIASTYKPSKFMLPGEPYLHGYLDNFEEDCSYFADKHKDNLFAAYRDVIVENRLTLWHFHAKGGADHAVSGERDEGLSAPFGACPYLDVTV